MTGTKKTVMRAVTAAGAAAVIAAALTAAPKFTAAWTAARLTMTPWASVGGCGAGGSGGAGGGTVKWIGRGVPGGLLDVQVLSNLEIGQTRRNMAFIPRFAVKPTRSSSLSLTVPVLS